MSTALFGILLASLAACRCPSKHHGEELAGPTDVHDIPPFTLIGQSGNYPFDPSRFDLTDAPPSWVSVPHFPQRPTCEIPPNPVYGCPLPFCTGSTPSYWCVRRSAGGGVPQGAMFGSMDGDVTGVEGLYDVVPYRDVTPTRWLARRFYLAPQARPGS